MIPLTCGSSLSQDVFAGIRRRMVLEFCKWDPQVEDVSTLCRFPLILTNDAWSQLIRWTEQLAEETLSAETELLARPDLLCQLGLPRTLKRLLCQRGSRQRSASAPRIMRFDFHWTTDGWRISEVNSDVPGGFIESSAFTRLVQQAVPGTMTTGEPAQIYALALASANIQTVGLVHATAYSDDRQVMTYLSHQMQSCEVNTHLISPTDVSWQCGHATIRSDKKILSADLLVRFYPGEWLPNLPRRSGWQHFFLGSETPISNPGTAIVTQSKRLPIVWDKLSTAMPTWRKLLPETQDPRCVPWKRDESWVLKPALGRVGEGIGLHGVTSGRDWVSIRRSATWWPTHWVAQRRFEMVPLFGSLHPVFPVIGVYTVNRRVAGIYARLAARPLIDHLAQDVAVLTPCAQSADASTLVSSGISERAHRI
jgi:glutathionylspermidine synthase